MNTLSQGIQQLKEQGFTHEFEIDEDGYLTLVGKNIKLPSTDAVITTVKRYEGNSNPSDMSILYGIVTRDNLKGILIDAYGVNNSADISKFVRNTKRAL
jgi:hypothetical protein